MAYARERELLRQNGPSWVMRSHAEVAAEIERVRREVLPRVEDEEQREEAEGVGTAWSAWEAMRRLQERATMNFERAMPILHAGWKELERAIELDRLRVEQEVAVAYEDQRFEEGERMLTRFMEDTAERLVDRANDLIAAL